MTGEAEGRGVRLWEFLESVLVSRDSLCCMCTARLHRTMWVCTCCNPSLAPGRGSWWDGYLGALFNCCIYLIATSGEEDRNSETAERMRLNCGELRRPWGWGKEAAWIGAQSDAHRNCPSMHRHARGTTNAHLCHVCSEGYWSIRVLAYVQMWGHR